MSSTVANRCTRCFFKFPYGIGCRIATVFSPQSFNSFATRRDTGLFPQPVRVAQMDTTGTVAGNIVRSALNI
jgi:hypothetical protein